MSKGPTSGFRLDQNWTSSWKAQVGRPSYKLPQAGNQTSREPPVSVSRWAMCKSGSSRLGKTQCYALQSGNCNSDDRGTRSHSSTVSGIGKCATSSDVENEASV